MKTRKLFILVLVVVMAISATVFAATEDFSSMNEKAENPIAIDFSMEGRNINVLSIEDGKLTSYDKEGVKTITYLSEAKVKEKVSEIGIMSFDTGYIDQYVPKNIDGNQGIPVGGSYYIVSPHNYVNLNINRLPQTTMPTINVAFTNESGSDVGWTSNVSQGNLVWMQASYPNQRYAARVSTNELYAATGNMRAYTD